MLDKIQLFPPGDWSDFENLCLDLWRKIWRDTDAKRNGRTGQYQDGVDIYGIPADQDGSYYGIQCKEKNIVLEKKFVESEIKKIIKEAKKFVPSLAKLIIATTAFRDSEISKAVRLISEENKKQGSFAVDISFWEDIVHDLNDYPEVTNKYYKNLGLTSASTTQSVSVLSEKSPLENPIKVQENIEKIESSEKVEPNQSIADLEKEYHAEIDNARKLLENNKAQEALEIFEKIKERIWQTSSDKIKYRILTNMAVCYSELKEEKKSANLFIEAFQYNPDDDQALANASSGHLILQDTKTAKDYARKAIEKNSFSARGYSSLVQSSPEELEAIIQKVPKVVKETTDFAYSVGFVYQNKKDFKNSIAWLIKAMKYDEKNLPEIKATLADVTLQELTNRKKDFYFGELPSKEKQSALRSIELYSEAWSAIQGTSLYTKRANWILNRSIAKKIIGDIEGSIEDLDIAISIEPKNNQFLMQRAILTFEKRNGEEALKILDRISGKEVPVEVNLLKAEILSSEHKAQEAIDILIKVKRKIAGIQYIHAQEMLFDLYLYTKNLRRAAKVIEEYKRDNPTSVNCIVMQSQLLLAESKKEEAYRTLLEAKRFLGDNRIELALLADQFYKFKKYDDASEIYEKFVDLKNDTPLTRRIAECYYRGSKKAKALDICKTLRKKHGPIKFIAEMEAAIYEETGNLKGANDVFADYIQKFPDNFSIKVDYAGLLYRSQEVTKLDKILSEIDINSDIPLELKFKLAFLLFQRERNTEALTLMYMARKRHFNEPDVHTRYIGLFFNFIKDDYFKIKVVEKETAVKLVQSNGSETWYVITDQSPDVKFREIPSNHKIAELILGKKNGDEIEVQDEYNKQKLVVKEIKSKFIYALHESMNMISEKTIESKAIWSVDMKNPETNEFDPKIILKTLDERAKRAEEVLTLYKEDKITIGIVAKMLGMNNVSISMSMINDSEAGPKVSNGIITETIEASAFLGKEKATLVVDIFTLINISKAKLQDLIVKHYGKLGITQSSIDDLNEFLVDFKGNKSKGNMILSKKGGRYIRQEVSKSEITKEVREISNLLSWTDKNCRKVTYEKVLEMDEGKRKELEGMLGKSFFDSILASSNKGHILYSDDLTLRRFAETSGEFETKAIWTQPLLLNLSSSGKINNDIYSSAILRLMLNNNYFLNFDNSVLMSAARESSWLPKGEFAKITSLMNDDRYELGSIIKVATNFIYELWQRAILPDNRDYLILGLFNQLLPRTDAEKLMKIAITRRFRLLPTVKEYMFSLIESWVNVNDPKIINKNSSDEK